MSPPPGSGNLSVLLHRRRLTRGLRGRGAGALVRLHRRREGRRCPTLDAQYVESLDPGSARASSAPASSAPPRSTPTAATSPRLLRAAGRRDVRGPAQRCRGSPGGAGSAGRDLADVREAREARDVPRDRFERPVDARARRSPTQQLIRSLDMITRSLSRASSGRFDYLDGIRGLAILAVVIVHWGLGRTTIGRGGFLAVDMFFVLSGFVITTLLWRSSTLTGLSLRQGWVSSPGLVCAVFLPRPPGAAGGRQRLDAADPRHPGPCRGGRPQRNADVLPAHLVSGDVRERRRPLPPDLEPRGRMAVLPVVARGRPHGAPQGAVPPRAGGLEPRNRPGAHRRKHRPAQRRGVLLRTSRPLRPDPDRRGPGAGVHRLASGDQGAAGQHRAHDPRSRRDRRLRSGRTHIRSATSDGSSAARWRWSSPCS